MHFQNALVLVTALSAGSAVARLHGHDRRHQHEARSVGSWVTATIDGQVVSWINTYSGATAAADSAAPAATTTAAAVANHDNVEAVAATTTTKKTTATAATATSYATGFGATSTPSGSEDAYCGNHGIPYGSNMIEITEAELDSYDYTITLDGSDISEEYKAYFWNKCTEDGSLAGFFADSYWNVSVPAGGKAYVAIDTNTQGGFISIPATDDLPTSSLDNIILAFWGEFDFADAENDGWSGFDVSAIDATIAGVTDFPGLKLEGDGQISYIATDMASSYKAYTSQSQSNTGGIGGNVAPGAFALTATLNYSG